MEVVLKHLGEYWFGYAMLLLVFSSALKGIILACRANVDRDEDRDDRERDKKWM